jgi:hypothetical protein
MDAKGAWLNAKAAKNADDRMPYRRMRQSLRSLFPCCLALLLVTCGGSSSGPTAPSTPQAATAPDAITLGTAPGPGATINVGNECTNRDCSSAIAFTFSVTFHQQVSGAEVYYQLFDTSGRQCGFAFTDPFTLPAGQSTAVRNSFVVLQCDGTFTTATLRATLFGPNTQQLPVSQRPGLFATVFNGGFTFVRPVLQPDPRPTPTPGPKPTPDTGGDICAKYPLPGDAYNCKDFLNHDEAQKYHDRCDPTDRNHLDADHDGKVCE